LGDKLIVVLTRDDQLMQKKGYVFMSYEERKEILKAIRGVDEVVPNIGDGIDMCRSLIHYRPNVFAQGGDRVPGNIVEEEVEVCKEIGCKIVYGVGGGKIQSSSWLVKKWKQQ
jgi:D-beta-D-heptose 7-phosphate kinase/D-beta-D-heptose 1-phosphate adenosyltransferase